MRKLFRDNHMTKKDYELIAEVLKPMKFSILDGNEWDGQPSDYENVCRDFAQALQAKNPNFDKNKFLQACGIGCAEGEHDFSEGLTCENGGCSAVQQGV